jgi:RNA polymerase sigma-70 factor, ECF subfamily
MKLMVHRVSSDPAAVGPATFTGDDAALVEAMRRGHRDAARVFYDRYADLIERVMARILGVDAELPDLVQDALLRALHGLPQVRDGQALPDWVMRVAVSTATDCLRRRRTKRRFVSPLDTTEIDPDPPAPGIQIDEGCGEALRATYAILARLPDDERIAFVLRTIDERPLGEIAAACGCSLATIKRRLSRAETKFMKMAHRDPVLSERLAEQTGEPS